MAYIGTDWKPGVSGGTMVTAARLNNMEAGIRDANEATGKLFTVGAVAGDAVPAIQAKIDEAGNAGGGTVTLYPGHQYAADGTIQMRSNVILDLNGSTLTAINNAGFADIGLGNSPVYGAEYNPASIKPVVSVIGTVSTRLQNVSVINGTIDGNGVNQPDLGSHANVAVFLADNCTIDVISVNARPGITVNLPGGGNTMRRAFCLFVGNAYRTTVRGTYRNSGYDTIGLREGAEETVLDNVASYQAARGAIQVATTALRTKIIGGIYDNTEGGEDTSHAIFCHAAVSLDVIGATMRANTGSCFLTFGDTFADGEKQSLIACTMEQVGDLPMISFPSGGVKDIVIDNLTFVKSGDSHLLHSVGSTSGIRMRAWSGKSSGTSAAFQVTGMTDFEFTDMDIESGSVGNAMIGLTSCARGRITGDYTQVAGVGILMSACEDIRVSARIKASDPVYVLGGNTRIDVIDSDLSGSTNPNKLRLYGPDSGLVRGNKGAITEASGVATVPSAATSVTVSHGLWVGTSTTVTPRTDRGWEVRDFQVSFGGSPGSASSVWVSSVSSTQVTFMLDAAPGLSVPVQWAARMDRSV